MYFITDHTAEAALTVNDFLTIGANKVLQFLTQVIPIHILELIFLITIIQSNSIYTNVCDKNTKKDKYKASIFTQVL